MSFKSGFVALLGRPNVGKSTLMNALVGEKVSIISPRPQTTRTSIRGILTNKEMQVVFVDTPGIHKERTRLGSYMNKTALASQSGVDMVLYLVDSKEANPDIDVTILQSYIKQSNPIILVVNKMDQLSKFELMNVLNQWSKVFPFKEIIPISAIDKTNLSSLLQLIASYLPEGPAYYPETMIKDRPDEFFVSEIIREKILWLTHDEVPHSIGVIVERIHTTDQGNIKIDATILVERDSQKGIIIGEKGALLRKIESQAIHDLEKIFQTRVKLSCFVRVEKDWRNNPRYLKELGYRFEKE